MAAAQHDSAGNQTTYGPYTLGYDAESRTTTITSPSNGSGTYWYDGDGRRVKKVWTPAGGATATTYYFYNALGQLAAEYSSEAPTTTGTAYMFSDMLGSVRAITSQTGAVTECYDYLPFGRMLSSSDNGRASVGCHPANPEEPGKNLDTHLPWNPAAILDSYFYQSRIRTPFVPGVDGKGEIRVTRGAPT